MLKDVLRMTEGLESGAVLERGPRDRTGEPAREGAGAADRDRRLLMAGGRAESGSWTWMAPDAREARRALPGPWSLTLLLRARPGGDSPP